MTEIELKMTEDAGEFTALFEKIKRGEGTLVELYNQMKRVEFLFDTYHMFVDVDTRNAVNTKLMHCMGWMTLHITGSDQYVKLRMILDSMNNLVMYTGKESDILTLQAALSAYQLAIDELMIVVEAAKLDSTTMTDLRSRITDFKTKYENAMNPDTITQWKFFKSHRVYEDLLGKAMYDRDHINPGPDTTKRASVFPLFKKKPAADEPMEKK